ncbi:hypothetical protein QA596_11775 [Balneolales bacterium ANBcel1]|nr:hypothetical protein [Balneolales bacterium ANBcel1]
MVTRGRVFIGSRMRGVSSALVLSGDGAAAGGLLAFEMPIHQRTVGRCQKIQGEDHQGDYQKRLEGPHAVYRSGTSQWTVMPGFWF